MTAGQKALYDRARKRWGAIQPCAGKSWEACFTVIQGRLAFWYTDSLGSTHMELGEALKGGKART